jgi:hypothetical protein
MRKYNAVPVLFLMAWFFTRCDNASELLDVTFETEVTGTMSVAAKDDAENRYEMIIDATSDEEVAQYVDKIKDYEIVAMDLAIENYSATTDDDNYFNGTLGFGATTSTEPSATCAVNNLNIKHIAGTGYATYNDCDDVFTQAAATLTADNQLKLYMTGTVSVAPCEFDLLIRLSLKVTANPL